MVDRDERRRDRRQKSGVQAFIVVVSGKDGAIRSPRERVKLKDVSPSGVSLISPSVRPGGMHVMYNDLMLYKNSVELVIDREGEKDLSIKGKVVWYDKLEGMSEYVIGIEFDEEVDLSLLLDEE